MMSHDRARLSPARPGSPTGEVAKALPVPPPLLSQPSPALFLDFDGTLVEIADRPDGVTIDPALTPRLLALGEVLGGRLAIVTGRALAALDALLGPLPLAMAGSHGGELRHAGSPVVEALAPPLPEQVARGLVRFGADHGGLLVEVKPFSVAAHYRHHPRARDALLAYAAGLAADAGLLLTHGKQVVELSTPGSDKGNAVKRLMAEVPFAGARPLFVGDDTTDEHAFAAVRALGGHGILVGAQRETSASWRLDGVDAVRAWLGEALDAPRA